MCSVDWRSLDVINTNLTSLVTLKFNEDEDLLFYNLISTFSRRLNWTQPIEKCIQVLISTTKTTKCFYVVVWNNISINVIKHVGIHFECHQIINPEDTFPIWLFDEKIISILIRQSHIEKTFSPNIIRFVMKINEISMLKFCFSESN